MKNLITYESKIPNGVIIHGYAVAEDVVEWLLSVQDYPETYIILNVLPISSDQAHKLDNIKGR